jgi:hypothetical protein
MELKSDFETFLREIRPTENQRENCKTGHNKLRERLGSYQGLDEIVVADFLQGSYRRATAVRPQGEDKLDVDIVVVTSLSENDYTPVKAMEVFIPFLNKYYEGKWRQQGRSMGIGLSDIKLDLVITSAPSEADFEILQSDAVMSDDDIETAQDWRLNLSWVAISARQATAETRSRLAEAERQPEWKAEPLRIPDRDANQWESTHPLEQHRWTAEKNKRCNRHFVNVVKAIKWWRLTKYEKPEHPKGFPLERLVGECCPDGIGSVAEGIARTLGAIVDNYSGWSRGEKIELLDYGVPENDVFGRISPQDLRAFYVQVKEGAELAKKAYESKDRFESGTLWRELLGNKFPKPPDKDGYTPPDEPADPKIGRFA